MSIAETDGQRWREHGAKARNWAGLILLAVMLAFVLTQVGFPAAVLLGSMIAGIVFGVGGAQLRMPRIVYILAQGFAGVFIARSLTPSILVDVSAHWPLLILFTALTLASAFFVGWSINRWGGVAQMPAILGSLPGMSGAMVIIAQERGIDGRIVALMQYTRLASVIFAVSMITHFLPNSPLANLAADPVGGFSWTAVGLSALLALIAPFAARLRWIPAAAMLAPLVLGAFLEASGAFHIVLLDEVVSLTFAVIGLEVGLKFTRESLANVVRIVPVVLVSCLLLIALSALLALVLRLFLPIDMLTAFLATAPGSIETVAIVAIAGHADVSVVLAFQTVRMLVVVLFGPFIMKQIARIPIWKD
ncbi:membrane AbrB-like protein [Rhizobium sp. SG_E_25_P2]|uniref:AbrB family transcriptional regulator n=1 Tax=Rhizobium sp. SG_E_25_P2 TaxID=2879942 RepID=UPI002476B0DC|nr:AbrB family transcriptional regulator [Rhizobium sp. SG_E_25_P2]MDH6264850.1 membrane AbrB-like protein [Rhizobium sp. SG_E_25_P2]